MASEWKKWECPPDMLTVEEHLKTLQMTQTELDEAALAYFDEMSKKAPNKTEQREWAGLLVRKRSKLINNRLKESIVTDFQQWLQGRSRFNVKRIKEKRFDPMTKQMIETERDCTPWGNKDLLHLPDVCEWLKLPCLNRDKVSKAISILKMTTPLDIDQAWIYYKYIVRAFAVDGNILKEQRGYNVFDFIEKYPQKGEMQNVNGNMEYKAVDNKNFQLFSMNNPPLAKFNQELHDTIYKGFQNDIQNGNYKAVLDKNDQLDALSPNERMEIFLQCSLMLEKANLKVNVKKADGTVETVSLGDLTAFNSTMLNGLVGSLTGLFQTALESYTNTQVASNAATAQAVEKLTASLATAIELQQAAISKMAVPVSPTVINEFGSLVGAIDDLRSTFKNDGSEKDNELLQTLSKQAQVLDKLEELLSGKTKTPAPVIPTKPLPIPPKPLLPPPLPPKPVPEKIADVEIVDKEEPPEPEAVLPFENVPEEVPAAPVEPPTSLTMPGLKAPNMDAWIKRLPSPELANAVGANIKNHVAKNVVADIAKETGPDIAKFQKKALEEFQSRVEEKFGKLDALVGKSETFAALLLGAIPATPSLQGPYIASLSALADMATGDLTAGQVDSELARIDAFISGARLHTALSDDSMNRLRGDIRSAAQDLRTIDQFYNDSDKEAVKGARVQKLFYGSVGNTYYQQKIQELDTWLLERNDRIEKHPILIGELEALKQDVTRLNQQKDEIEQLLTSKIDSLTNANAVTLKKLELASSANNTAAAQVGGLRSEKQELENQLALATRQSNDYSIKAQQLENQLKALQGDNANAAKIQALEAELQRTLNEGNAVANHRDELLRQQQALYNQALATINEKENQIAAYSQQSAQLQAKIDELNSTMQQNEWKRSQEIKRLEGQLAQLSKERQELEAQVNDAKHNHRQTTDTPAVRNNTLLFQQNQELRQENENLFKTYNKEVGLLKDKVHTLNQQTAELKAEHREETKTLQKKIDTLKNQMNESGTASKEQTQRLQQLQAQLEQSNARGQALEEEAQRKIQEQQEEANRQIAELTTKHEQQTASNNKKMNALEKEIRQLKKNDPTIKLEQKHKSILEQKEKELEAVRSKLFASQTTLETTLRGGQQSKQEIEKQINSIKSERDKLALKAKLDAEAVERLRKTNAQSEKISADFTRALKQAANDSVKEHLDLLQTFGNSNAYLNKSATGVALATAATEVLKLNDQKRKTLEELKREKSANKELKAQISEYKKRLDESNAISLRMARTYSPIDASQAQQRVNQLTGLNLELPNANELVLPGSYHEVIANAGKTANEMMQQMSDGKHVTPTKEHALAAHQSKQLLTQWHSHAMSKKIHIESTLGTIESIMEQVADATGTTMKRENADALHEYFVVLEKMKLEGETSSRGIQDALTKYEKLSRFFSAVSGGARSDKEADSLPEHTRDFFSRSKSNDVDSLKATLTSMTNTYSRITKNDPTYLRSAQPQDLLLQATAYKTILEKIGRAMDGNIDAHTAKVLNLAETNMKTLVALAKEDPEEKKRYIQSYVSERWNKAMKGPRTLEDDEMPPGDPEFAMGEEDIKKEKERGMAAINKLQSGGGLHVLSIEELKHYNDYIDRYGNQKIGRGVVDILGTTNIRKAIQDKLIDIINQPREYLENPVRAQDLAKAFADSLGIGKVNKEATAMTLEQAKALGELFHRMAGDTIKELKNDTANDERSQKLSKVLESSIELLTKELIQNGHGTPGQSQVTAKAASKEILAEYEKDKVIALGMMPEEYIAIDAAIKDPAGDEGFVMGQVQNALTDFDLSDPMVYLIRHGEIENIISLSSGEQELYGLSRKTVESLTMAVGNNGAMLFDGALQQLQRADPGQLDALGAAYIQVQNSMKVAIKNSLEANKLNAGYYMGAGATPEISNALKNMEAINGVIKIINNSGALNDPAKATELGKMMKLVYKSALYDTEKALREVGRIKGNAKLVGRTTAAIAKNTGTSWMGKIENTFSKLTKAIF